MKKPFSYALIRVVPRVERGECVNVGVVLYCQMFDYLGARTNVDEARLRALHPGVDVDGVRDGVRAWELVCGGEDAGGPAARETKLGERFRWLTAPKSTVIQAGPVHMGMTADPAGELERLMDVLVR
ncbi:hypothetical protein Afil01_42190 [Actinorhabdospora filicis]|uniref:DUF3037 domain-containing protein n=1 Tax=Actinorhabdospora filicis TaxID=1785913 RepID=A0A9W6SPB7_9ACTN|nr:DUF3037 domain-containing protein [Actinorhabdospora filicis]GLZ79412.1 hypothetical protein Afil01_42190 [Actinorhabdospora filicis]